MKTIFAIAIALTLIGCDSGPSREDMAGCTTGSNRITALDVAECAIYRANKE